jgi:hypothetical protein
VILDGSYTALLQAGSPATTNLYATSIFQVGRVPDDALSIRMKVYGDIYMGVSYFRAAFDGQDIPLNLLEVGMNYKLYGGNVSSFSGRTGELRFTALPVGYFATDVGLDSINFSPIPVVPEPSTWVLLVLGSAFFWCAARRRKVNRKSHFTGALSR